MRDDYDFSKSVKNPHAKKLKERTTIRLEPEIKIYFQKMAKKKSVPYQTLINLYLMNCVEKKIELETDWKGSK